MDNFEKERKAFESTDKRNMQMEINYIINQLNNLYELINKDSKVNTSSTDAKKKTTIKKVETPKTTKTTTKKNTSKKTTKKQDKPVEEYVVEEFKSWGIDENCAACKFLLSLKTPALKGKIKSGMSIDDVILLVNENPRTIKAALTNLRKKSNFSNAKYCKLLTVMDPKNITNEVIINQVIEFFS